MARAIAAIAAVSLFFVPASRILADPGQSFEDARHHWAYQPVRRPELPRVRSRSQVESPIDAFLLTRLEAKGLRFSPAADRRTLLRRVSFDLIGLPPTFAEVQAFEKDESPAAFSRVIERLLASPRYGERWGRHWLDVARYADTKDLVLVYGKDALRPYAYTFRDYVIRAFNEDMPFDQFIEDQIAADLVKPARPPWRQAALGFLTVGRLFDNNLHDQRDDQIDTVTRGLLGLTVSCARCHDHKYDAITMDDYYGLYGVFASTEQPYDLPLIEQPKDVPGGIEFEEHLAKARQELEQHVDAEFAKLTEILRQRIGDYLVRAATTPPDITETTQFALSLVPEDFRPTLMTRTRRFLLDRVRGGDRVFGAWARLMELPEGDEFMAEAATTISDLAKATAAGSLECSETVLDTLAAKSLTNRASVVRAYGEVLVDLYNRSKAPDATKGFTPDQLELIDIVAGPIGPVWFPRQDTQEHMSRPDKDRYLTLVQNLDKLAAHATNPPPARAMVVVDSTEPFEPYIFLRGNPSRRGASINRGFPRVFQGGEQRPFHEGSGRLELARAIASPTNPLTARVLVNRVWMHHFGEPLVASTADFGTRSDPPTHPELLDWLASEFSRSGWSVKHLHRVMLLSTAYQQSSFSRMNPSSRKLDPSIARSLERDPDNRYLWHYPRRRLDLEAMRDSLLFTSGRLDPTLGGRPFDLAEDSLNGRRTVYGLVDRQNLAGLLRSFDFAVPDQCAERRPQTTVPQQALFALNSPFVLEQARALAALPRIQQETDPHQRVDALIRHILARPATRSEIAASVEFVRRASADPPANPEQAMLGPWEQLAQVFLLTNERIFLD